MNEIRKACDSVARAGHFEEVGEWHNLIPPEVRAVRTAPGAPPNISFGLLLVELRENVHLTQHEIAAIIEEKRGTYAAWEEGRATPNPRQLAALSLAYKRPDLLEVILNRVISHSQQRMIG